MNDRTTEPQPTPTIDVRSSLRALGPVVAILTLLTVTLPMIGGFLVIGFAKKLQPWVQSHGTSGFLAFAALFGVTSGFALMPTYAMSFASGVFFGFGPGFGAAMIGILLGSVFGYAWGATIARPRVMKLIESNDKARVVREALIGQNFGRSLISVILLRFPPNSPFALTNLVMSSTRVNPVAFLMGTAIGIAPRTGFAVWIGAKIGDMDKIQEDKSTKLYVIGASIIGFIVIYQVFSRWAKKALNERLAASRPNS